MCLRPAPEAPTRTTGRRSAIAGGLDRRNRPVTFSLTIPDRWLDRSVAAATSYIGTFRSARLGRRGAVYESRDVFHPTRSVKP